MQVTVYAENPVEAAILRAGGVDKLADLVDVSRESIRLWRKAGRIPEQRRELVARVTGLRVAELA